MDSPAELHCYVREVQCGDATVVRLANDCCVLFTVHWKLTIEHSSVPYQCTLYPVQHRVYAVQSYHCTVCSVHWREVTLFSDSCYWDHWLLLYLTLHTDSEAVQCTFTLYCTVTYYKILHHHHNCPFHCHCYFLYHHNFLPLSAISSQPTSLKRPGLAKAVLQTPL